MIGQIEGGIDSRFQSITLSRIAVVLSAVDIYGWGCFHSIWYFFVVVVVAVFRLA